MSEPPASEPAQTLAEPAAVSNGAPVQASAGDAKNPQPATDDAPKKLSPAELKRQSKAEKQARRAQAKASEGPNQPKGQAPKDGQKQQKDSKQTPKDDKSRPMAIRRRPSQSNAPASKDTKKENKKDPKQTGLFFGHLYNQPKLHSMKDAPKDIHPAILALGLQYSSYLICGSTARMVAMLLAFKAVIESYKTPVGTSLARHLSSHHLSPQIDYLKSCRPLSTSMGNAIRWLKETIVKIDPSTPETEAKRDLVEEIDIFIRERVTATDKLICDFAGAQIEPGDVILTYASSSIVEQAILQAHKAGVPFSVIIVDSKPLFEGKQLARRLVNECIKVRYYLITGASHAVQNATKVFLGAHAMMSNGRLYSRVGTAIVSMLAHTQSLPVIVLCQSVKFTEKVALDSIVGNEVAPAEEILSESEREALLPLKPFLPQYQSSKGDEKSSAEDVKPSTADVPKWIEESRNLHHLQILYDVTPAAYIKEVITEYGSLPPSSVPVVHRLSTNT